MGLSVAADDSGPERFEILGRIAGWRPDFEKSAELWLANFDKPDQTAATALLDAFVYIESKAVDAMFSSALGSLASVVSQACDYKRAKSDWCRFVEAALVTRPTGERPNPTDSGYLFQRRTRQFMDIDESQIVEPADAIRRLGKCGGQVVFVDDIVGSGDQFLQTWHREYELDGSLRSFADISQQITAHYVPLFATQAGVNRIRSDVPDLNLMPVHLLGFEHSANRQECLAWTDVTYAKGFQLVEKYSRRLGIATPWGYKNLGLCIAFEHGVPDATIPLFHFEHDDWRPLVLRR